MARPLPDGCAVVEVYVDKLGRVTRRDYWWIPTNGSPEPISARRYAALVKRGTPYEVNTYGPCKEPDT